MIRVADYVIERLVDENIKHIFLITGRGILYLSDAVAKNQDIEGVSTYHEQGASYAAMAYATARDGMGACLVSTGCAATNAVTAVLCAYQDNLPCIFISGQNLLNETTRYTGVPIRTYGSQEADIVNVVESITKYSTMVMEPEQIKYEMDKAIYLANEGRKGPVWIDIPLDVQNARVEPEKLIGYTGKVQEVVGNLDTEIEQIISDIEQATRPIIFIGGGARSGNANSVLKEFVESNQIPVVFSTSAADIYGSGNEFSIGAVGSLGGSRAGNFAVQNADYILVLGSKLCSQTVGSDPNWFGRDAKITVVDIDRIEHTKKGVDIDNLIIADVKIVLERLNQHKLKSRHKEWLNACLKWKEKFSVKNEKFVTGLKKDNIIDLYIFADELSKRINTDTTVITDAGFEELIIPSTIRFKEEQRCLFPAAQGAMGYAIPAIIGAYYAGKKNIVTIVGDGSIMMNIQELLLISERKIPVKIFVINNNMYAVIRKRQQDLFRKRTIGNDPSDGLSAPNFEKIAKCFDIAYRKIENWDTLEKELDDVLEMEIACICEVMCTSEQKYFHTSYAINEKRRLVKRPLEDLSPFLDREIFQSEMIVERISE